MADALDPTSAHVTLDGSEEIVPLRIVRMFPIVIEGSELVNAQHPTIASVPVVMLSLTAWNLFALIISVTKIKLVFKQMFVDVFPDSFRLTVTEHLIAVNSTIVRDTDSVLLTTLAFAKKIISPTRVESLTVDSLGIALGMECAFSHRDVVAMKDSLEKIVPRPSKLALSPMKETSE